MSPQQAFSEQILAFHAAIIDDCDRAARTDRSDTMALKLRNNALALTRMQLAMLALTRAEAPVATAEAKAEPEPGTVPRPVSAEPPPVDSGRLLTGDTLSRFVSRPLDAGESPHEVWQQMQDADPPPRRRNAALPRAGFRSPSS